MRVPHEDEAIVLSKHGEGVGIKGRPVTIEGGKVCVEIGNVK